MLFYFCLLLFANTASSNSQIEPCPASPNCVCTLDTEPSRKRMEPLTFDGNLEKAKSRMRELIQKMENAELQEETDNYLHFTFKTKLGKFIDDVEFEFNEANKEIDFRSASRVGYSDMGANKRRMKKITKLWNKN